MAQAFAIWLIRQSNADVDIALIVAQATLLRLSKIVALRWRNVLFPGDPRIQGARLQTVAVVVRKSKAAKPGEMQLAF